MTGSDQAKERRAQGGKEAQAGGLLNALHLIANTRRIAIGNRQMFEDMNAFLEEKRIHPVVDDRISDFEEARETFMYLWQGKHLENIVIRVKH